LDIILKEQRTFDCVNFTILDHLINCFRVTTFQLIFTKVTEQLVCQLQNTENEVIYVILSNQPNEDNESTTHNSKKPSIIQEPTVTSTILICHRKTSFTTEWQIS
jgi:hypothetical protein